MPNSIVLDTAIRYAARGWAVFPLNPNSKAPHRKLPSMPPGEGGLYLATTDLDQVKQWFTQWPDANIGIACGATSGYDGPWVLDVDNKQGKHGTNDLQTLEQQHGVLPATATVFTPNNGEHRYFANDPRTAGKVNGKLYGHTSLDLQGTGCYVVAPPSTIDGKPYVEDAICPFATTPLAKLPQWIIDGMRDKPADVAPVPPSGKPLGAVTALTISKHMLGVLLHGDILSQYTHPNGTADTSAMLAALENTLVRAGYGDEDIILLLMNPQHKGGAKAHKQGADWLRADIARIRAHGKKGREEGSNAQEEKTAEESAHNLDAQGILDQLSEAEEPDASVVYRNIATFAALSTAQWEPVKAQLKSIFGGQINLNGLEKARGEARREKTRQKRAAHSLTAPDTRPDVHISTEMGDVIDAAQAAIIGATSEPTLFHRAHGLVLIAHGGKTPKSLNRPPDSPVITEAAKAYLRERMATSATFLKYDMKHDEWNPALPPEWVPETLIARKSWDFPPLEGILCSPTMRLDGSLLEAQGYDVETGLFLMLNNMQFPSIPSAPTLEDAQEAVKALLEVFVDFPFQHEYHRAAAVAAVLSLVGRYAIDGNVPLFAVSATTRGSGKGKLVNAISTIATGRAATLWAETTDDEEERKRLLTLAMEGDTLVLIDNITQPLGSAALDAALTSPTFKDRLLGRHQSQEAAMSAVFFATGNNIVYKGDTARRVIPISLAPNMERPEEREDFLHPHLLAWLEKERPRLVSAALTILRAYHVAGRPKQPDIKQIGSFEEWNDLVRSALIWTGQPDPAVGRLDLESENDTGYDELLSLLDCWQACFGERAATLKEAVQNIESLAENTRPPNEWNDLRDALGAFDPHYDGKVFKAAIVGKRLYKLKGRVLDSRRLHRGGRTNRGFPWSVECLKPISVGSVGSVGSLPVTRENDHTPLGGAVSKGCGSKKVMQWESPTPPTPPTPFSPKPPSADDQSLDILTQPKPSARPAQCPRCGATDWRFSVSFGWLCNTCQPQEVSP